MLTPLLNAVRSIIYADMPTAYVSLLEHTLSPTFEWDKRTGTFVVMTNLTTYSDTMLDTCDEDILEVEFILHQESTICNIEVKINGYNSVMVPCTGDLEAYSRGWLRDNPKSL
jgi:hypothetical protein